MLKKKSIGRCTSEVRTPRHLLSICFTLMLYAVILNSSSQCSIRFSYPDLFRSDKERRRLTELGCPPPLDQYQPRPLQRQTNCRISGHGAAESRRSYPVAWHHQADREADRANLKPCSVLTKAINPQDRRPGKQSSEPCHRQPVARTRAQRERFNMGVRHYVPSTPHRVSSLPSIRTR